MKPNNILIITGSARSGRSTTLSIAEYIKELFDKESINTNILNAKKFNKNENQQNMFDTLSECDIVIIAFPLYVDGPPYLIMKTFEILYNHFKDKDVSDKKFIGICHGGFFRPERHSAVSLDIAKNFAEQVGFHISGLLGAGGTSVIEGKPLSETKFPARNLIKSIKIMVSALLKEEDVPMKAVKVMSKRVIPLPLRLVAFLINKMRIRLEKKNGRDIEKIFAQK